MVLLGRLHLDIFRHSLTILSYVYFLGRYIALSDLLSVLGADILNQPGQRPHN
jgi:hypothetical protein